jgi:hypothetical protein
MPSIQERALATARRIASRGPANGLNLIGAASGRPITTQALTDLLKRAAMAAGLPAHCLPHGPRKARMRRLA